MAAYIAPINHNRIDSTMVASIISTMTGNYCRDTSMDNTHLQDMGSDAAVLLGYYDKSVSMSINIHIVYFLYFYSNIYIWIYFANNVTQETTKKKCYQISSYESRRVAGGKRCIEKTFIQR
jgi:hypothetical protein